jgi:hypothetical protein
VSPPQAGVDPHWQVPAGEQLSAVVKSQATQLPPPTPQLAIESGTQAPLAQHPFGQESALQRQAPPTQVVPLPQLAPIPQAQAPVRATQPSLVAGSQATQAVPPTPQVAAAGVRQAPPAQQPPGHDCALQTQAPAWQVVPAAHPGLAPHRQSPAAAQLSARAGSQLTQAAPPDPQVAVDGVAQVTPEQQPPGQFAAVQLLHTPPVQMRPAQS